MKDETGEQTLARVKRQDAERLEAERKRIAAQVQADETPERLEARRAAHARQYARNF